MRITIEIDEKILEEIQKSTAIPKKSPAIQKALETYLRTIHKKRIIEKALAGKTDYPFTNDELEKLSSYDSTPLAKTTEK